MRFKFLERVFKKSKIASFFTNSSKSKNFTQLKERLEDRRQTLSKEFEEKQTETVQWLEDRGVDVDELWFRGTRGVLSGVATGLILVSTGLAPQSSFSQADAKKEVIVANKILAEIKPKEEISAKIIEGLSGKLPTSNRPLTLEEEKKVIELVNEITGVKVAAELEGKRLNTNYGRIGLEQHLPRYPGETIAEHFESSAGSAVYGKSGMTKNRGAFGYFARNEFALTAANVEEEKYYAVVQTFLSPGWGKDKSLPAWYKHRKVMIINPVTGRVVIGDIADSGPAKFTGKNFGGSPELMDSLGTYYGNSKTSVLLFFVDETGGSPKLGPL